jgi:hypothetical protein
VICSVRDATAGRGTNRRSKYYSMLCMHHKNGLDTCIAYPKSLSCDQRRTIVFAIVRPSCSSPPDTFLPSTLSPSVEGSQALFLLHGMTIPLYNHALEAFHVTRCPWLDCDALLNCSQHLCSVRALQPILVDNADIVIAYPLACECSKQPVAYMRDGQLSIIPWLSKSTSCTHLNHPPAFAGVSMPGEWSVCLAMLQYSVANKNWSQHVHSVLLKAYYWSITFKPHMPAHHR